MLHIPNSVEGNCLTEKENHTLCLKSDIKPQICKLPKCNREKQSRLGPPCFCFFSKPLIYGFWRNAHDHAAGYVNIKQWRSQDFSKGRSQTGTPSGDCRLYMVYTAALPRVSAGSVIAAWRSILTKDESRWRKYFTEKQILKKWAFQQCLLWPRYCHGVFATWIL